MGVIVAERILFSSQCIVQCIRWSLYSFTNLDIVGNLVHTQFFEAMDKEELVYSEGSLL